MVKGIVSKLLGRRARPKSPSLPSGRRLYAVGDIHGRCDLLERLLEAIRKDAATAPAGTAFTLVFLGDYVDRGLQSRDVVDRLLQDPWPAATKVFLRGNHDEMLRCFLEAPDSGRAWFDLGGAATLYSYGVGLSEAQRERPDRPDEAGGRRRRPPPVDDWPALSARFAAALPAAHRHFFDETQLYHVEGDYLFVHAGVRPGLPLERQDPQDLMTIRDPFLNDERGGDHVVVHGHSPVSRPTVTPTRIAVDTGAYTSGRLTALVLEGEERSFLHT